MPTCKKTTPEPEPFTPGNNYGLRRLSPIIVLGCALIFPQGCAAPPDQSPPAVVTPASARMPAANNSDLEGQYVIGPAAARRLGYRIDWQSETLVEGGSRMRRMVVQGDSVFALDDRNFLTRMRSKNGDRIWRVAVASPLSEILGISYLPQRKRIHLTTGGEILEYDATTGALVGRQRLEVIANTEPLRFDQFMIYGSRNGQVIWHSYAVEFQWKGYQVDETITIPPQIQDHRIVAVGNRGRFMVLDARDGKQLWSKRLGDTVSAPPALGPGVVFVAGEDQYLHAFDLYTGRVFWKHLFERPLTEPPTLIGEQVYQQVPGSGLLSFDAIPLKEAPNGVIQWSAPEVSGNVFMQHRDALFTWDARTRLLTLLSASRGSVRETISLARIMQMTTTGNDGGDIYAMSRDGRIVKLVPRNPRN